MYVLYKPLNAITVIVIRFPSKFHYRRKQYVDVEWRIGSVQAFGARGHGFDSTSKPRMTFFGSSHLPSFRQRT